MHGGTLSRQTQVFDGKLESRNKHRGQSGITNDWESITAERQLRFDADPGQVLTIFMVEYRRLYIKCRLTPDLKTVTTYDIDGMRADGSNDRMTYAARQALADVMLPAFKKWLSMNWQEIRPMTMAALLYDAQRQYQDHLNYLTAITKDYCWLIDKEIAAPFRKECKKPLYEAVQDLANHLFFSELCRKD